jgi:hypothetical protein
MDLRRLGRGEWIASLSGLALLVSLFLPWYDGVLSCPGGTASCAREQLSAWQTLSVTDMLLALIAAFAVLVLIVTATQRVAALPLILDGLLTLAGLIGVLLVLVRVLALPGEATGRSWALWLGLLGALGIVIGASLAMRDERLSTPGRPTDATGRPIPPPSPLPTIPAPPANSS